MGDFSLDLRAVLTIISILTTIFVALTFQWWRNRKILSYQIISNTALLTANEEIREKLKILYEKKPVKNVRLFILRIINNGIQSIDDKDFKKPLSFTFSDDARVLSVETIEVNPNNLDVSVTPDGNRIVIEPILLNSKDFFDLKVLVSSYEDSVKCDGRIVAIKEIKKYDDKKSLSLDLLIILPIGVLIISLALIWINYFGYITEPFISSKFILMSGIFIAMFLFWVILLKHFIAEKSSK
jgi:hypothetical protein